ncbi:unnamed protein product [Meloidogyne enterolobii]|uniref:Uncharacterized protein n=1 Tax=Meloidogyne enterolobii TaxID=390850 RepID=A0ACB0Z388_MELEN
MMDQSLCLKHTTMKKLLKKRRKKLNLLKDVRIEDLFVFGIKVIVTSKIETLKSDITIHIGVVVAKDVKPRHLHMRQKMGN